jgi:chitin biosynthesis protein CHS5
MLPVAPFYLGATPVKNVNALSLRHQSMSQASLVRSPPPNSNSLTSAGNRSSLPPPARNSTGSRAGDESTFVNQHQPALEPMPEDSEPSVAPPVPEHSPPVPGSDQNPDQQPKSPKSPLTQADRANRRKSRHGTMDRAFKFPDTTTPPAVNHPDSDVTPRASESPAVAPAVIEVPPPPPVEKERAVEPEDAAGDDELGETEDIPL